MMRNGIPGHHALGLEPLLQKHKVDMYIAAHMHSYERFLPVYNGSSSARFLAHPAVVKGADSPVHVVTGAAGNVENQEGFASPPGYSAFRSSNYGYNRMTIHNDTHLEWTFVATDNSTDQGVVEDRMWLEK